MSAASVSQGHAFIASGLFKKLRPTIALGDPVVCGLRQPDVKYNDLKRSLRLLHQNKALMILIAGPYRSGTNDDPVLIQKNVDTMESYALPIFRAGHIPILGEWLALPLAHLAGSKKIGDEPFNEIFHPIAVRLQDKCDAVLRVGGPSAGADEMVRIGRELGLKIYTDPSQIPRAEA
jgi:hypothetical protein